MSVRHSGELRKFVAPEVVFGPGARTMAPKYAQNYGCRHVLLVSDPGVVATGWVDEMATALTDAGITYTIFSDLTPNPKDGEVGAGMECFASHHCDSLLAVGGGSVVDCAKGIGILAGNGGSILSYIGVDTVTQPCPPLLCVPTTAGAAADVSQFAIITDSVRQSKCAIISKTIVPDVSLIDPAPLLTLPDFLIACTGMDALTHAIEAYVSNASSLLTDLFALKAIELVAQNLPQVLRDRSDEAARLQMCLACLNAGLAFSNASLGAVHALAHSLGGYLDLPHGECNALLLEHVVACNFDAAPARYREIGKALGGGGLDGDPAQDKAEVCRRIARLREQVGITGTLGSRGVSAAALDELVAFAAADPCLVTNPRVLKAADLKRIYEGAL